jgi:hypothetical protein
MPKTGSALHFALKKRHALLSCVLTEQISTVGCFDGGFLQCFGPNYSRFGLEELHEAASKKAQ